MAKSLLEDLDELKRRLAPYLLRATKVIAFGSVARGDPDEWSDLDLIIVAETSRPFLERFQDALKGLHYLGGARLVLGHSVVELLDGLVNDHPALRGVREIAQQLDQYYIPTRYPNGLPAGAVPSAIFTKRQADEALAGARAISAIAAGEVRKEK